MYAAAPLLALWLALLALCALLEVAALSSDPMGVSAGASYCRALEAVKHSGFNAQGDMTLIHRIPAASPSDARARWNAIIEPIHGSLSILRANRDAMGNLQHHLKVHRFVHNWSGHLIVKASYASTRNGPRINHLFALDLDDTAGCVLSTASANHRYKVEWSYQLTGNLIRRE